MAQGNPALTRRALPLAAVALLAGCSLPAPYQPPPPPPVAVPAPAPLPPPAATAPVPLPAPAEATPRPAPPAREIRLGPASRALVDKAHAQMAHGELPAASATLDRALRIEPSNALLWVEIGRLRLVESDAHQAEGCARKALALANGDRAAQSLAGHLLADALRAQRRVPEAREVEAQPYMN